MKKIFYLLLLSFFLSCKVDKVEPSTAPLIEANKGFFVINEGGFTHNNASLGYYNFQEKKYYPTIFTNNYKIGDVLQSAAFINNELYAVINNSNTLLKIDVTNGSVVKKNMNFNSPRYIIQISANEGLVSDLFEDKLYIIDLQTLEIKRTLATNTWTETLLKFENKVFITCPQSEYLLSIALNNPNKLDSIPIGYGSVSSVVDKNDMLWVLCSGDDSKSKKPSLCQLNPTNNQIVKSFEFSTYSRPSRMCINATNDTLFYINNDIVAFPIAATSIPTTPYIAANGGNFYGLSIYNKNIVVLDAKDYNSLGTATIYNQKKENIASFTTGIIPSDILKY